MLKLKSYREMCEREKAANLKQLDPDRDPGDNELKGWARRLDRFLLAPRPWLDAPPPPAAPAPTTPTEH